MKKIYKLLEKVTIKDKLSSMIVLSSLFLFIVSTFIIGWNTNALLYKEKLESMTQISDITINQLQLYANLVKKGKLSLKEAQIYAKRAIANIRYDNNTGYIWIQDYNNVIIMHPINPDLVGQNWTNKKDINGVTVFPELKKIAKQQGSEFNWQKPSHAKAIPYLKYCWSKPGRNEKEVFPKLSYAKDFPEWGWIMGTGVYVDDIQHEVVKNVLICTILELLGAILIIFLSKRVLRKSVIAPLEKITETGMQLAQGDIIDIPDDNNKTEIGDLSRSFKKFVEFFKQRDKLLTAVGDAINELVQNHDFDKAIVKAFEIIGNAIDVDRVVLFKNDFDKNSFSYEYEWVIDSSYSQIDDPSLKNIPMGGEVFDYTKPQTVNVKDLSPWLREILTGYKLRSIMSFPIYIDSSFYGHVSFDDCKTERTWSDSEKAIISSFTASVAAIIERTQRVEREKKNEKRLGTILNNIEEGIITVNNDFIIESCNPAITEIYGYSQDELTGKTLDILIPHNCTSINDNKNCFVSRGNETYGINKNGKKFPIEIEFREINYDDKNVLLLVIRDISQRKEVEQAKNEFISTVSHELRTPLTSIRGALGLILSGTLGNITDEAKDMLDIANNNSIRLITLINDILDIEKIESGKMNFHFETLEILPIIEQAIEENKSYAEQFNVNITLDKQLECEKSVIDKNKFLQVMANLLSNAIKFSPSGETVKISAYKHNNEIIVAVKDCGQGIPDEFKNKIFEKFAQADSSNTRQKGGTGLGLSISKAIVEKMNAEISFESKIDEGSTFFITLPILQEKTIEFLHENQTKKILICEDDRDVASFISLLLKHNGYLTDIAYSANEARKLLSENDYDALTLDLILPDDDGISLIYELRKNEKTKFLPVLVVSIKANQANKEIIGNFALVDWLNKPIDENKLISSLKSLTANNVCGIPNILHVEDDPDVLKVVKSVLKGIANISQAVTVEEAREKLQNEPCDLLLLDLSLPDGNGMELLPLVEQNNKKIITVIFSATNVDKELYKKVDSVLLKSVIDNKKLLEIIEGLIHNVDKAEYTRVLE
jgi:PAS domain S-box-containing protein